MKIGVLIPVNKEEQDLFIRAANGNEIDFLDKHTSGAALAPYEVLVGFPNPSILDDAISLRYLQLTTAGADRYVNCQQYVERGILLAGCSGAYGTGVSEWMLAMTMMMFKKLHLYRDNRYLSENCWSSHGKVKPITGSTIVCVGTGDIGTAYAKRVKALGAHVIGICRTNTQSDVFCELYTSDKCMEVFHRADAVAMSLPSTKATYHFLSKELLTAMPPDCYLINAGRGNTVDLKALSDAITNHIIAGAALDVTDPEPLPDSSPLWKMPNVMISPHVAGGFNLDLTKERISSVAADNLSRYIHDKPLHHVIDFSRGY